MRYPIPDNGDLFTIQDFIEMVKGRAISNDDGTGYYATKTSYYRNLVARPSDIAVGIVLQRDSHHQKLTHVIWFNK